MYRFEGIKVAPNTIKKVLVEEEVYETPKAPPKRKSPPQPRRFERANPMQLWQSDITSYVLRRTGQRVYLVVFKDDHSRYIVSWALALKQTGKFVMECFLDGTQKFGKPEETLTDQGRQYFSWRGKSEFQKLLENEGVKHVVSRSHHPQTLGKCERLWKTIGIEFWNRARPQELGEARERLAHFINHYNHFRPHQGIGGVTPADRFFGVEKDVRELIEKNLTKNELLLSIDQRPRKPFFFVGQVGEKKITIHGEGGKLSVNTPDGETARINYEDFGNGNTKPVEITEKKTETICKKKRGRKKKGSFKLPPRPAIPVRGLWESATEEQQKVAHLQAITIMEYWMGQSTKIEAAKKLEVPPLRIWQLSQLAISGMCAGLLKQPKRKDMTNKEDDPKYLKKKIAELEEVIGIQEKLIMVLREMPGCKQVTYKEELRKEQEQKKKKAKKTKKKSKKKTGVKRGRRPKEKIRQEVPDKSGETTS